MNGLTMKCKECGKSEGDLHNTGLNNSGVWYCHTHYWNYLQNL